MAVVRPRIWRACTPTSVRRCVMLDRLIVDAEGGLASARSLAGDERDRVVADLAETLDSLRGALARLRPVTAATPETKRAASVPRDVVVPGEVELQASWVPGRVVVWASGRGADAGVTRRGVDTAGGDRWPAIGMGVASGGRAPRWCAR